VYKYSILFPWFKTIAVGEWTSPRVDQSATWPAASWFVGELSSKHYENSRKTKHVFTICSSDSVKCGTVECILYGTRDSKTPEFALSSSEYFTVTAL